MKYPSKEYDELVQRNLRGNVSSVKMTPEETKAEIEAIQDGAISTFGDSPIGNPNAEPPQSLQSKKRRGRPPGSRNKPK